METNIVYQEDCIEGMKKIPSNSIDLVLTDPPYNITNRNEWDKPIDLEKFWVEIKRIIKPNGAIVMTASQPFTTDLINSNREMFKYELIWEKEQGTNQNLCMVAPLKKHENILIFINQDYQEFSEYLKSKREEKKLSKSQIDKILGLNTSYSWWEGRKKGIQPPTAENYLNLKRVLDLDNRFDEMILEQKFFPQMEEGQPYNVKRNGKVEFDPIIGNNQKT